MAETWLPINTGRQQSSFKYFTITLQPSEVYDLPNPFTCFRCYDATADFQVAWSSNADFTDFGEGMMVQFVDVIPTAKLFNPNNVAITLKIGVGIGTFEDSRLSVAGSIQTRAGLYDTFSANSQTISGGQTTVAAGHSILQNIGSNVMYIGGTGTNGLQLLPYGSLEIAVDQSIVVWGTNGDKLVVGVLA